MKESIYSPGSVGVNKLIQDGAHLVTNVQDILMALNLFMVPQQVELQAALPDNSEERTLLALLSHDPLHIDEIIRESGLPTTIVSSTLAMMESKTKNWYKRLQRNAAYPVIASEHSTGHLKRNVSFCCFPVPQESSIFYY